MSSDQSQTTAMREFFDRTLQSEDMRKMAGLTPKTTKADLDLMRAFQDGQPVGDIRLSLKRGLAYSVDDASLSDAEFREAVRLAVRNPWYE